MKLRFFLYGFLLLISFPIWSQKWANQGHRQFQELAYSAAIISLEKAVEKGQKSPRIYTELADSYYFNANYQASAKWFQLLFQNPKNILPIHYFRYAQSLKSIGKLAAANAVFKQMDLLNSKDTTAVFNKNRVRNSGRFQIQLAPFNSKKSDFSPAYFGNQIVFTSTRDTGGVFKRNHSWTYQSFTDLFVVEPDSVDAKPIPFSEPINTKSNESSAVFTKDGLTMYFTRNNSDVKNHETTEAQMAVLKIYKAIKKEEKWVVIGALPFCTSRYNVAHPALSPDEKTLYFSSDMPGGFGQSDLYKVAILEDKTFGTPVNLGATINTFARETFPFMSRNNQLYFASDNRDGFGGLDVYVTNRDEHFNFSLPQNVGEPINSRMDDFGFIIDSDTKSGFFTSNRSNGIGMDDIYSFKEVLPLPCEAILEGTIFMESTAMTGSNVAISLLDANGNLVAKTTSDEKGNYQFKVDCNQKQMIQINAKGFVSQEIAIEKTSSEAPFVQRITLQKEKIHFEIGDDIAQKIAVLPIYFDVGKSNIRLDAALELTKIKLVLVENPSLFIQVRSHTDSRDSAENNQILSANRAEATVKWFVENGINSDRLSGVGFGETQLLNPCKDEIPCSDSEHQINRRSEFIITKI